jgi:hypothetical protein
MQWFWRRSSQCEKFTTYRRMPDTFENNSSVETLAQLSYKNTHWALFRTNKMNSELMLTYDTPAYMFNVYKNQPSQQTGSRNLMGPKMLTTIWGTNMKLVAKYQIPVINSCWEKYDKICAYMLNVYKSQLSRQTGSRNLTGQKTLPTKWGTYMKLVTKYQISAINISWEKCDEKWAYMGPKNASHNMAYLYEACDQISDSCHQYLLRKMQRKMCIYVKCV